MSTIYPRGKKGIYYYEANGKRQSLKTSDKQAALFLQNKFDKKSLLSENNLPNLEMTWVEFREEYFKIYSAIKAPDSFIKLEQAVKCFERIVEPRMLAGIQPVQCETWQAVRGGKVAPQTVNTEQRYLSPMLRKAHERGYIERNPFSDIRRLKASPSEAVPLTTSQSQQFMNAMHEKTPHYDLLALFFYETGMRLGEVAHQRIEDINFMQGLINVKPHDVFCDCFQCKHAKKMGDKAGWKGKHGVPRIVPISTHLNAELLRLFQDRKTGCIFPYVDDTIGKAIRRAHKKAGTYQRGSCDHIFRHTLATDMERAGVRRAVIKVILGHAKSTTTDSYIHVDPGELHAEFQKVLDWRFGANNNQLVMAAH